MKRIGFLLLLVTGFWFLISDLHAQQETLTLITYYPAPYGVYRRGAFGQNFSGMPNGWLSGKTLVWIGDINDALNINQGALLNVGFSPEQGYSAIAASQIGIANQTVTSIKARATSNITTGSIIAVSAESRGDATTGDITGIYGYAHNTTSGAAGNAYGGNFSTEHNTTGSAYGLNANVTNSGSGPAYGLKIVTNQQGTGAHYGINSHSETIAPTSGNLWGISNEAKAINSANTGTVIGIDNIISTGGTGYMYGIKQTLTASGTDVTGKEKYGIYLDNDISRSDNKSNIYGIYTDTQTTGDGGLNGIYNTTTTSGTGTLYGMSTTVTNNFAPTDETLANTTYGANIVTTLSKTNNKSDAYGIKSSTSSSGNGNVYGIYSSVGGTGTGTKYAGYFDGDVQVGPLSTSTFKKLHFGDGLPNQYVWIGESSDDVLTIKTNTGTIIDSPYLTATKIIMTGGAPPAGGKLVYPSDVAETVKCDKDVSPGDIVVINNVNIFSKSSVEMSSNVAGIISENPKIALGAGKKELKRLAPDDNYQYLCLAGITLCNADASYGEINPGDLLTTSPTPGHAMKAKPVGEINGYPIYPQGCIVGKALEPLKEGKGKILVLVCLM